MNQKKGKKCNEFRRKFIQFDSRRHDKLILFETETKETENVKAKTDLLFDQNRSFPMKMIARGNDERTSRKKNTRTENQ